MEFSRMARIKLDRKRDAVKCVQYACSIGGREPYVIYLCRGSDISERRRSRGSYRVA